jgi:citrate synthase
MPGFGHPLHRPTDPRAQRLLALAEAEGVAGPAVGYARALEAEMRSRRGDALPMNVSIAIPAVMLDLDFPLAAMKGIPLLARTASLIAHLVEESASPTGFLMAHHAEQSVDFVGDPVP